MTFDLRAKMRLALPLALVCVTGSTAAAQVETQRVFASDAQPNATFSNKVAIDGDWAMVADADRFGGEGVVYVFEKTPTGWIERQILHNPHPDPQDYFGSSLVLGAGFAVISCPRDDVACPTDPSCESGSAYAYDLVGGSWVLRTHLVPADIQAGDFFGYPLALSGSTLLLGAQYDDETMVDSGSVYVYERGPGGWSQVQKLNPSDPGFEHRFGKTLDISGDLAIIGSPWDHTVAPFAGSAYVFERTLGSWQQVAKLESPGTFLFGIDDVAIDGDTALVAGTWVGPPPTGWVHHFERDPQGTWSERSRIQPRAPQFLDNFGCPILLDGDRAVIGADDDDEAGDRAGAFYVFDQDAAGAWTQTAKVLPPGLAAGDILAVSLATSDGTVLAGALNDDGQAPDAGAAYFVEVDNIRKSCGASPNQTGLPAELWVRGTAGVQTGELSLVAGPVPSTQGMFFYGTRSVQIPFGSHMRCVGGRVYRLGLRPSIQGRFEQVLDYSSPPQPTGAILPGATWHFQAWFRDPSGGTQHGFSDALEITFGT